MNDFARNKKVKGVVFHCSDSEFGSATLLNGWHLERGWDGIGYTAVICNGMVENNTFMAFMDGAIEWGRDIDKQGAHTLRHNDKEGVVWIGKSGGFTINQLEAGRKFILYMMEHHGLDPNEIEAHSDLDKRKPFCPGINIKRYVQKCINLESLDEFVGKTWN